VECTKEVNSGAISWQWT